MFEIDFMSFNDSYQSILLELYQLVCWLKDVPRTGINYTVDASGPRIGSLNFNTTALLRIKQKRIRLIYNGIKMSKYDGV